jgi:outer membrane protein assembly factor BamB
MLFRWLALLFCSAALLRAADWPQWRGPFRNGHTPPGVEIAQLPAEPKVNWRRKIGEGLASPVGAGAVVVYADNQSGKESVHAANLNDGQTIWSATLDDAFKDSQGPQGPRCTPLIDGDLVYAQSCKGELKCLSLKDGRQLWHANYLQDFGAIFIGEKGQAQGASRHGYNGSPVIDGERLIVVAGGTNGAGVVCFNKKTGKVLWKSQNDPAAYAAPVIEQLAGARQVIAFTAVSLLGLNPETGDLLWRIPLKTTFARHAVTPVVIRDKVYVSSHEWGLLAVQIQRKNSRFEATRIWTNKEAALNFASPVASGEFLYGVGPKKNIVCVDGQSGRMAWSKDGYFTSSADKAWASLILAGGNLLILTDGGELVMLKDDPQQAVEIGRAQVCGFNWCQPAIINSKLVLRDRTDLVCLQLAP